MPRLHPNFSLLTPAACALRIWYGVQKSRSGKIHNAEWYMRSKADVVLITLSAKWLQGYTATKRPETER